MHALSDLARFLTATLTISLCAGAAASAGEVLVLSSANADVDAQLQTLFESQGHIVTIGPRYGLFDGANIGQYDVVLTMNSYSVGMGDMPLAGQEAVRDFVRAGGGLITGEWILWGNGSNLPALHEVLPAAPSWGYRSANPITYSIVTADPILTSSLPDTFEFPTDVIDGGTEIGLHPKTGARVYFGSDYAGGEGLVGRCSCQGRAVSFSTLISASEVADPEYAQLLLNAVDWVLQEVPPLPGRSEL